MPEVEPLADVPQAESGTETLQQYNLGLARKLGDILAKKSTDSEAMLAQVDPEAAFARAGDDPEKILQVILDACMAPTGAEAHSIGIALLPQAKKYCARNSTKYGTDKWAKKFERLQLIRAAALPHTTVPPKIHDFEVFKLRCQRGDPSVDGLHGADKYFSALKELTEAEAYDYCCRHITKTTDEGGYKFSFSTYSPGEVGVYRFIRTQKSWNIAKYQPELIAFFRVQNNTNQHRHCRKRLITFPECRAAMATAFGITDTKPRSVSEFLKAVDDTIAARNGDMLDDFEAKFGHADWHRALRDELALGFTDHRRQTNYRKLLADVPKKSQPLALRKQVDSINGLFSLLFPYKTDRQFSLLLAEIILQINGGDNLINLLAPTWLRSGYVHPEARELILAAMDYSAVKNLLCVEKRPIPDTTVFQSIDKKQNGEVLIQFWRHVRSKMIQEAQDTTEIDELLCESLMDWQIGIDDQNCVRHVYAELATPTLVTPPEETTLSSMLKDGVHRKLRATGAATVTVPTKNPSAIIAHAGEILKAHTPSMTDAQISRLRRHPKKTLTALFAAGALGATVEWYDQIKTGVRSVRVDITSLVLPEPVPKKTTTPNLPIDLPPAESAPDNNELPSKLGTNALAPAEGNEQGRVLLRLSQPVSGRDSYFVTACLAKTSDNTTNRQWHDLLSGGIENPPARSITMQIEAGKATQVIPLPPNTFVFDKNSIAANAIHPQKLSNDAPQQIQIGFPRSARQVAAEPTIEAVKTIAKEHKLQSPNPQLDFFTLTQLAPDLAHAITEAKHMPAAAAVEHVRKAVRKSIIYQSAPELMEGNRSPAEQLKKILQLRKGVCVQTTIVVDEALAHLGVPHCTIVCLKAEDETVITRKHQHACNGALLLDTDGNPYLEIVDATGSAAEADEKIIQQELAQLKEEIETRERTAQTPRPVEHPIDPLTLLALALTLSSTRIGRKLLQRYLRTPPATTIEDAEQIADTPTLIEAEAIKPEPEPNVDWEQIPEPTEPKPEPTDVSNESDDAVTGEQTQQNTADSNQPPKPVQPRLKTPVTTSIPIKVEPYLPEPAPESPPEILTRLHAIFTEVFTQAIQSCTPKYDAMAFGKVADDATLRLESVGDSFMKQNLRSEPIYTQTGSWSFAAWLGALLTTPALRQQWLVQQQAACTQNAYRAVCVRRMLEHCLQQRTAITARMQQDFGRAPGDEAPMRLYQDDPAHNALLCEQFFAWLQDALEQLPPARKQNPVRIHTRTFREALQWNPPELPKNDPKST